MGQTCKPVHHHVLCHRRTRARVAVLFSLQNTGFISVRKLKNTIAVAAAETFGSPSIVAMSVDQSGLTAGATNTNSSHRKNSKTLLCHIQPIGVITAVIYSVIWYSFLIFHGINSYFILTGNPIIWSETMMNTIYFINISVVIIVGPNMLLSFFLHFISSSLHYHGDNESGNVIQETQVLNPWWLYPINFFCFNFGSTHAIHHLVVNEPFYIRQLSASVAHKVMKDMGVRFNDFGSFSRANRWNKGQHKHE